MKGELGRSALILRKLVSDTMALKDSRLFLRDARRPRTCVMRDWSKEVMLHEHVQS